MIMIQRYHDRQPWINFEILHLDYVNLEAGTEVTDASYAAMAECVMINKGDHTLEVLETLRSILHRTAGHHAKKRFMFRPLNIAKRLIDAGQQA
jgi:pyruvate kinase